MFKSLRNGILKRQFNLGHKYAILTPINTLVPQDLIYLTHFKKPQQEFLSFLGTDEILTTYSPNCIKNLEFTKENYFEKFLENTDEKFKQILSTCQKEVLDFRLNSNQKQTKEINPDITISLDEIKSMKKTSIKSSKSFFYSSEKHVSFDEYLHNLINNFHSQGIDTNNQINPSSFQNTVDQRFIATLSKIDFYDFFEGKFRGRVCRMEGKGNVELVRTLDPSNFDLQSWLKSSVLNRIKNYDSNINTLKKINTLNNSGLTAIQHSLDSLKSKVDEQSSDFIFKNEEKLWKRFEENNFKIVEYVSLPDTQKFINDLDDEEFKFLVNNLLKINESLKSLMVQTGFIPSKQFKEISQSLERSTAAAYYNNTLALLISKQVITSQEIFFLSMEQDFLLRSEYIQQAMKNFATAYLSSWSFYDNKAKFNENGDGSKTGEAKQMEEMYEQLKKFYDEGSSASKKNLIDKVNKLLKSGKLIESVQKSITEELNRFSDLNEHDSDYQNCKNYLELILKLPFGKFSIDQTNISKAKKILEDSHYGMEDVKSRILQFLAIGKMKGTMINKKIICLLGPPGVGKTSISKSIAECLGRKFVRVSLGGENDVAIIKGHRRTYIGSYPGKIINALKMAGTENPVILLDEVDKVASSGHKGNVQDVLLEILDPSQNHSFFDHYLDMPVDLSKVLFLCSANILDNTTITPALYDRMEVIELSGYTKYEKQAIFRSHLLTKMNKKINLGNYDIDVCFSDEIIEKMINDYAREPGVRNLEKNIQKIFEKIAFDFLKKNPEIVLKIDKPVDKKKEDIPQNDSSLVKYEINSENIKEYLGPKVFFSQTIFHQKEDLIGFAFGLGYNAYGGSVLSIEVLEIPHLTNEQQSLTIPREFISNIENIVISNQKITENLEIDTVIKETPIIPNLEPVKTEGSLIITGSLGNIMKESVEIAYSFAKFYLYKINKDTNYLENKNLHIHFPEGASKKDGPSAGITIVTSLISAAIRVPYRPEFAMTGEISLNGKVLKIGGLREKVLAAKREGIPNIIVPKQNSGDVEEMKSDVKEGMNFFFVENYDEVYQLIFGNN